MSLDSLYSSQTTNDELFDKTPSSESHPFSQQTEALRHRRMTLTSVPEVRTHLPEEEKGEEERTVSSSEEQDAALLALLNVADSQGHKVSTVLGTR